MKTQAIYKAVKNELTFIAPVFFYLGQYLKGKDNTSYRVPAVYVEMPKYLNVTYFGKIKTARKVQFKVHVISNAPHKANDNPVQDSAIISHERMIADVDKAIQDKSFKDEKGKFLTNQCIEVASSNNNYDGVHVYSIVTYQTDFYDRG